MKIANGKSKSCFALKKLIIEYVDPTDVMGVHLLASRPEVPHGYSRERFEQALRDRFEVLEDLELKPTRSLWLVRRRS